MTNPGSSKPDGEAEATDESCVPRSSMLPPGHSHEGRMGVCAQIDGLPGRNVEDER